MIQEAKDKLLELVVETLKETINEEEVEKEFNNWMLKRGNDDFSGVKNPHDLVMLYGMRHKEFLKENYSDIYQTTAIDLSKTYINDYLELENRYKKAKSKIETYEEKDDYETIRKMIRLDEVENPSLIESRLYITEQNIKTLFEEFPTNIQYELIKHYNVSFYTTMYHSN